MTTKKKTPAKADSFAEQFAELEELTAAFERGDYDLDEGLAKFEHGLALAQKLKERLQSVEQRVEKLKERFDVLRDEETKNDDDDGTD
ncbi:MAG: exodeoxyribonuclease VII small subunit [Candidatus Kerfeldbacteria bacterium]|nr:exodeoxyribonuclease VII small subunit [Candidatus Kerfeldbacteria bacterium]